MHHANRQLHGNRKCHQACSGRACPCQSFRPQQHEQWRGQQRYDDLQRDEVVSEVHDFRSCALISSSSIVP